jgi:hypothetical protein
MTVSAKREKKKSAHSGSSCGDAWPPTLASVRFTLFPPLFRSRSFTLPLLLVCFFRRRSPALQVRRARGSLQSSHTHHARRPGPPSRPQSTPTPFSTRRTRSTPPAGIPHPPSAPNMKHIDSHAPLRLCPCTMRTLSTTSRPPAKVRSPSSLALYGYTEPAKLRARFTPPRIPPPRCWAGLTRSPPITHPEAARRTAFVRCSRAYEHRGRTRHTMLALPCRSRARSAGQRWERGRRLAPDAARTLRARPGVDGCRPCRA